ncbi:alkaline phosphatase family protein [bacterium]|nr:alkaline phosphatase family protein [bacterium]
MRFLRFMITAVVLSSGCAPTSNQKTPAPRLVVFISIDQLRYDYLTKFSLHFGPDGFNYLLNRGANFAECHYGHATNETAVGHATMMSGTYPYRHGIIANDWYDRSLRRKVYGTEDTLAPILGAKEYGKTDGRSPRKFSGTNLADQLKLHTGGQAKVFGVSNKDRSAILMAGKMADGVYWMDEKFGRIVTSAYYMNDYPEWMKTYQASKPLDKWKGAKWDMLLSPDEYPKSEKKFEQYYDVKAGIGGAFPHIIGSENDKKDKNYYEALMRSPFSSEALLELMEELMIRENLGDDAVTDILCVSFSANDKIGHMFGPMSREVMDITVRTDRYLARLFKFLDKEVGLNNILFVLTSDHGVPPIPEIIASRQVEAYRLIPDTVRQIAETEMIKKFGRLAREQRYVEVIEEANLYFNDAALAEKKIDKNIAEQYISTFLKNNVKGIDRIYTSQQLSEGRIPNDAISQAVFKNYYSGRTGDLFLVLDPYCIWSWNGKGTDHGEPQSYDNHVPMILAGVHWIKPGTYYQRCSPVDIAPTLAAILKIEQPNATDGRVLNEIIR